MHFTQSELSNGLTHIHVSKIDSEAITVMYMVGVGSRFEQRELSGISHYLEHLFFKGTKTRKNSVEIAEFIEEIGGEFNAFTGKEYTGFYATVAKKHTDRAFDFVSDLVLNATFPKKEMEKEKAVIIEEMNMYNDMPMRLVPEKFEEVLYGDTPAGWQIIGNKKTVSGLTHEQVTGYVTHHYNTQNSVVVTVGPKDKDEMHELTEKFFGALSKGKKSHKEKAEVDQKGGKMLLVTKKTDQTHLCMGFPTVSLMDNDRYAASIVAGVLGGGMSSRLFTEIRENRGLCYYIQAEQDSYTDTGYFVVQAGIDNTKVHEAIRAVMSELSKVKSEGVSEKELTKIKEYIKGKLALSLEGSQESAVYAAEQYVLKGKVETVLEKAQKIDAVTLADTKKIIDTYFNEDAIRLALIGPFEKQNEFASLLRLK